MPKMYGHIALLGTDITSRRPYRAAFLGMIYAAQKQALFTELSAYDNLGLEHKNIFPLRFKEVLLFFPVFENRLHLGVGKGGLTPACVLAFLPTSACIFVFP